MGERRRPRHPAHGAAEKPQTRYAKVRRLCHAPRPGHAALPGAEAHGRPPGLSRARCPTCSRPAPRSKGPAGGLTPADLASAYSFSPTATGAGQTVAIVDAFDDPKIEKDLATFDSNYGLPACTAGNGCFTKVGQTGSTSALPPADTSGWSVEISLDVETVHSVCQNCKILLVEANSEGDADLAAATNEAVALGADEVSNSYGSSEGEEEEGAQDIAAYDHPGVVIVASSGDSGYFDWEEVEELEPAPEHPDAPAIYPTVVSAGGTSLKLTGRGARKSEIGLERQRPAQLERRLQARQTVRRHRRRLQHAVHGSRLAAAGGGMGGQRLRHAPALEPTSRRWPTPTPASTSTAATNTKRSPKPAG